MIKHHPSIFVDQITILGCIQQKQQSLNQEIGSKLSSSHRLRHLLASPQQAVRHHKKYHGKELLGLQKL